MPAWFLALFFVILACIIAAFIVLFYFQFKEDDKPVPQGAQGPGGDQGEIGFTGLRGPQGFADTGPQGIPGGGFFATSNVVDTTYFFESTDNATFKMNPDKMTVDTIVQQIDKSVTLQAKHIVCFLRLSNANDFMMRIKLPLVLKKTSDIVAFTGYVKTQANNSTLYATLLTNAVRIDDNTLGIIFSSNSIIWTGVPSTLPSCTCFFSITYITS